MRISASRPRRFGEQRGQRERRARVGWVKSSAVTMRIAIPARTIRQLPDDVVASLTASVGGGVTRGVPTTPRTSPLGSGCVDSIGRTEEVGSSLGAWLGGVEGGVDGGVEGGVDGGVEGGVDGGFEGGVDGGVEGGVDGGFEGGAAGQSMMSDFFVWTAVLSALPPNDNELSGHGFVS